MKSQVAHEQYLKAMHEWEDAEKNLTAAIKEYISSQPVADYQTLPQSKSRPAHKREELIQLAEKEKSARKKFGESFKEYYGLNLFL